MFYRLIRIVTRARSGNIQKTNYSIMSLRYRRFFHLIYYFPFFTADGGENNFENFLESQRGSTNGNHENTDTVRTDDDDDVGNLETTYDDGSRDDLPPNASVIDLVGKAKEVGMYFIIQILVVSQIGIPAGPKDSFELP